MNNKINFISVDEKNRIVIIPYEIEHINFDFDAVKILYDDNNKFKGYSIKMI